MQENTIVGPTMVVRRARLNEKIHLHLDMRGGVILRTASNGDFGERVSLVEGDKLGVNHIPDQLNRRFGFDGLEYAVVEGKNANILRFPYHNDVRYRMELFAGHGITMRLAEHAEGRTLIVGHGKDKHLAYIDPIEDNFGSENEGC